MALATPLVSRLSPGRGALQPGTTHSQQVARLVRPWGQQPYLQEAGHGADVAGTCSLPHVIHSLARLQYNAGRDPAVPQSRCPPTSGFTPQGEKMATTEEDREVPWGGL